MKTFRVQILFVIFLLANLSCAKNILSELSSHSSDDALLQDAQVAINNLQYQAAIDIITLKVSASGKMRVSAKELLAHAYAGKCGLNFIDFVGALTTAGTVTAFKLVSVPFVQRTIDPTMCLASLITLDSIGPSAVRTLNDNAFAAIVGMSLMGTAIRSTTDITPIDGDGTPDAANIACTLTDPQIDNVILGVGYMSQNFSALGSAQIGPGSTATLTDVMNKCSAVVPGGCGITNPAAISNPLRLTMRDLLNTLEYGIGTYSVSGDDTKIPLACP